MQSALRSRWGWSLRSLSLLGLMLILGLLASSVRARSPLAVGLTYFRATPMDSAVQLEWHTESELNTAAFKIQRSGAGSSFVWLQEIGFSGYVMSEGGPAQPASYQVVDRTAVNGQRYTYKLIEIESDSSETEVAETSVTAGIPTPTATPTQVIVGAETVPPAPTQPPPATAENSPTAAATTGNSGPAVTETARPASTATRRPTTVAAQPTAPAAAGQTAAQPAAATSTPAALADASSAQPPRVGASQSDDFPATPDPIGSPIAGLDDTAYPAPQTAGAARDANGYPGETMPTPQPGENPTAYPANSGNQSNIPVIGSGSDTSRPPADAPTPTDKAMEGTFLLWGGCVLATLIFAASIFGSIYLYTRKRE